MKLYKDYSEQREAKKQMEQDREAIGMEKGVAIIYEHGKAAEIVRVAFGILVLAAALAAAGILVFLLVSVLHARG